MAERHRAAGGHIGVRDTTYFAHASVPMFLAWRMLLILPGGAAHRRWLSRSWAIVCRTLCDGWGPPPRNIRPPVTLGHSATSPRATEAISQPWGRQGRRRRAQEGRLRVVGKSVDRVLPSLLTCKTTDNSCDELRSTNSCSSKTRPVGQAGGAEVGSARLEVVGGMTSASWVRIGYSHRL